MNRELIELSKQQNLIKFARKIGFPIFENNKKDFNLNIWVIRSDNQTAGYFDDLQVVFWKDLDGRWQSRTYQCTADPSDHYLLNPINEKGTAIVKPGHYSKVWTYGYHRSRSSHPALIQVKPLTVIRDFNKTKVLDYTIPEDLTQYEKDVIRNNKGGYVMRYIDKDMNLVHKEETGLFGINNHRAHRNIVKKKVGLYSAGCIVQNHSSRYHDEYIPIIKKAASNWGNSFSFTLITECAIRQLIDLKQVPRILSSMRPEVKRKGD